MGAAVMWQSRAKSITFQQERWQQRIVGLFEVKEAGFRIEFVSTADSQPVALLLTVFGCAPMAALMMTLVGQTPMLATRWQNTRWR